MVGTRNTKYVHNSNNCDLEGGYSVLGCARTLIVRNYVELVRPYLHEAGLETSLN